MKVLLYTENEKVLSKSGLGKAIEHQKALLNLVNVKYTTDIFDSYEIAHINFYGLKSFLLSKYLKSKGKKIVYHAHSTEEDFRNSFIFSNFVSKYFKKWIIKCYSIGDVIITPTEYSKKLLKSYGIKNDIYVVSNGVETEIFKKTENAGKKFREKYEYTKTDKIVVGIGLFIERKGIIDFVELAKRMPKYKFIWFGYSPLILANKKVRNAINTRLDNLKFAGYVDRKTIIEALNGCDVYLGITYEETEGIPVIEAASCKTKMIVRDIPVFNGWLEDKQNVYKANNINEFEQLIEKVVNDKLPLLTDKAYEIAKQRSYMNIGRKLKDIYMSLMEK